MVVVVVPVCNVRMADAVVTTMICEVCGRTPVAPPAPGLVITIVCFPPTDVVPS